MIILNFSVEKNNLFQKNKEKPIWSIWIDGTTLDREIQTPKCILCVASKSPYSYP